MNRKLFIKAIKAPDMLRVLICKVNQDHLKFDNKDILHYMLYSTFGDWDIIRNTIEYK